MLARKRNPEIETSAFHMFSWHQFWVNGEFTYQRKRTYSLFDSEIKCYFSNFLILWNDLMRDFSQVNDDQVCLLVVFLSVLLSGDHTNIDYLNKKDFCIIWKCYYLSNIAIIRGGHLAQWLRCCLRYLYFIWKCLHFNSNSAPDYSFLVMYVLKPGGQEAMAEGLGYLPHMWDTWDPWLWQTCKNWTRRHKNYYISVSLCLSMNIATSNHIFTMKNHYPEDIRSALSGPGQGK